MQRDRTRVILLSRTALIVTLSGEWRFSLKQLDTMKARWPSYSWLLRQQKVTACGACPSSSPPTVKFIEAHCILSRHAPASLPEVKVAMPARLLITGTYFGGATPAINVCYLAYSNEFRMQAHIEDDLALDSF